MIQQIHSEASLWRNNIFLFQWLLLVEDGTTCQIFQNKTNKISNVKVFLLENFCIYFIGDSRWKSQINAFRNVCIAFMVHSPAKRTDTCRTLPMHKRSTTVSSYTLLPNVIMCSAALETKARQNLLHRSTMNPRAGQRPEHVFVPSNYIYT